MVFSGLSGGAVLDLNRHYVLRRRDRLGSGGDVVVTVGGSTYELAVSGSLSGDLISVTSDSNHDTEVIITPDVIIHSGSPHSVGSGDTAVDDHVLSGGTLWVLSGGVVSGTTVYAGGTMIISRGGSDAGPTADFGVETVSAGASVTDVAVSSGGKLFVLSGGTADPTTVAAGGTEIVSHGGSDLGALISGGRQLDYGYVSGSTMFGGLQVVEFAGTARNIMLSGGSEIVSTHGLVSGTTAIVASGFVTLGGIVNSGTISGSVDAVLVNSGGLFSGGIVNAAAGRIVAAGTRRGYCKRLHLPRRHCQQWDDFSKHGCFSS